MEALDPTTVMITATKAAVTSAICDLRGSCCRESPDLIEDCEDVAELSDLYDLAVLDPKEIPCGELDRATASRDSRELLLCVPS